MDELEVRDGFLGVLVPGRALLEALPERLNEIVRGLAFSKSMRWDDSGLRFARPVRWLCAKLDGADRGRASVGSSYGHRFTHGEVTIPTAGSYLETLRGADVEPDKDRRDASIRAGLEELGAGRPERAGARRGRPPGRVADRARREASTSASCRFRGASSRPRWSRISATSPSRATASRSWRTAAIRRPSWRGNEAVLEGRLEDASFTFERDVAKGIEGLMEEAARITFVAGAGSYGDKVERLQALVDALGGGDASREAARLSKADQAAELVREFPDLEGHIGAEYARLAGFPEAVCAAIDEQYLPDSAGGPLPETEAGRVLAAADKVDSLTVAFALGQRPTGSRDPYGLRRAAIGVCRLALEGDLELDAAALAARAHQLLVDQGAELEDDASDVAEFVEERLEGMLDIPVEFVRAARASGITELGAIARLAEALAAAADTDAFEGAYVAYDRANRLAGKSDGAAKEVDPKLATDEAELALIQAVAGVSPRISAALEAREFNAALAAAAELRAPVDRFFDEVLVMAEDAQVRANRLRLLLDVRDTVGALGDLAQIPR